MYRKIVKSDWELKWWHIPQGPLLLRRPDPAPVPEGVVVIQDYYAGHLTKEQLDAKRAAEGVTTDVEKNPAANVAPKGGESSSDITPVGTTTEHEGPRATLASSKKNAPEGPWYSPVVAWYWIKFVVFHGVEQDVVDAQKKRDFLSGDVEEMHATGEHFDNNAEYAYSFLQVLTAATSSFCHGANDVSNAIGPYTTIYFIWATGEIKSKVPVPLWILAFGGIAIVIGLWTYGYNLMRALGNKITLHSPSRGFSMELGSAITIVMATRLKLPVCKCNLPSQC